MSACWQRNALEVLIAGGDAGAGPSASMGTHG